jgi:hypothetical protein
LVGSYPVFTSSPIRQDDKKRARIAAKVTLTVLVLIKTELYIASQKVAMKKVIVSMVPSNVELI